MAITKVCKNRTVIVQNKYMTITTKLSKTADALKMEASKDNFVMNCLKKITATGEKTG
jgi:hypothetical protein